MPLNIDKLNRLFDEKGYISTKYFISDGYCYMIELFNKRTSDIFLMYIPSKYNFAMKPAQNIFELESIDLGKTDNLADEYGQQRNKIDIQDKYNDLNIFVNDHDAVEDNLKQRYNKKIVLDKLTTDDLTMLKSIYRQVSRLKYCVQNMKYKICIGYKNYFTIVRRNDEITTVRAKKYHASDTKRLYVVTDLEHFFSNEDSLTQDIASIRRGIYQILEHNQNIHVNLLDQMINSRQDLVQIPFQAKMKKDQYVQLLDELEHMLQVMIKAESKTREQLAKLDETKGENLYHDMNKSHERAKLNNELQEILAISGDLSKIIIDIRQKNENTLLSVDKIMFDNSVMFDGMLNNFGKLRELC